MRTYGTSPIYRYVELIFRARKMFIVSVIICLVASIAFSVVRSQSFTAEAVVFLSGSESTGPTQVDRDDKVAQGSIKYKMSILNVLTRDTVTLRAAFDRAQLTNGLGSEEANLPYTGTSIRARL